MAFRSGDRVCIEAVVVDGCYTENEVRVRIEGMWGMGHPDYYVGIGKLQMSQPDIRIGDIVTRDCGAIGGTVRAIHDDRLWVEIDADKFATWDRASVEREDPEPTATAEAA